MFLVIVPVEKSAIFSKYKIYDVNLKSQTLQLKRNSTNLSTDLNTDSQWRLFVESVVWCCAPAHQHKSVTSARRARQGHERACASVVTRSAPPASAQRHIHTTYNTPKVLYHLYA